MNAANLTDLSEFALQLSGEEVRDTRVLYFASHVTDLSEENVRRNGYAVVSQAFMLGALQEFGLSVTAASDPEVLFGPLDFDYIYHVQMGGAFEGKELLLPCIAAMRGIPCLGAPGPMRALSEDKVLGKALASALGLEVAEHRVLRANWPGPQALNMAGPWILKPRNGVMSRDTVLVEGEAAWRAALADLADPRHQGRDFLAEAFVPGLNLTVPVIEGFPPQSFAVFQEFGGPGGNILSKAGKDGLTGDYGAQPYDGPGAAEASAAAARLAAAIAPFDYARFDFRFDPERNRLVFLEFNIACMMGPQSVVARAAEMRGLTYQRLVNHVLTYSLRRQRLQL